MFKSDLLPIEFFKFSLHFSPVIANQYLFIFDKLEEDNICLVYNFPFGQTCGFVFSEPSVNETRSCLGVQVCRYCFNEFNDKDKSVLFMFREFEKGRKGDYNSPFLWHNPLSLKKYKII